MFPAIHGAGAGGILSSTQIILSDLVTLQERGAYNGLIGLLALFHKISYYTGHSQSHCSVWAIAGGLGPLVGGSLAHHTVWRWLFCT